MAIYTKRGLSLIRIIKDMLLDREGVVDLILNILCTHTLFNVIKSVLNVNQFKTLMNRRQNSILMLQEAGGKLPLEMNFFDLIQTTQPQVEMRTLTVLCVLTHNRAHSVLVDIQ